MVFIIALPLALSVEAVFPSMSPVTSLFTHCDYLELKFLKIKVIDGVHIILQLEYKPAISSFGSSRAPTAARTFLLQQLLEVFLYVNWKHYEWTPPENVLELFSYKSLHTVDLPMTHLNKTAYHFSPSTDWQLESNLISLFELAGSAPCPVMVLTLICQTIWDRVGYLRNVHPTHHFPWDPWTLWGNTPDFLVVSQGCHDGCRAIADTSFPGKSLYLQLIVWSGNLHRRGILSPWS